jgi:hypothetical protein
MQLSKDKTSATPMNISETFDFSQPPSDCHFSPKHGFHSLRALDSRASPIR